MSNILNKRINTICSRLSISIRDPKSELSYISEYTFLVAVMLSAQSTDVQVNKVTTELFKNFSSIDAILSLETKELEKKISSIGLFRTKAKNIMAMTKILKETYNSTVPSTRNELEAFPGVGRKTANVVLNTLFNQNTIAVDTHVLRLSQRLEFSTHKDPIKVENDLEAIIPKEYKNNISNFLVLHGRYVCKAKKPNCEKCVLQDVCNFHLTLK